MEALDTDGNNVINKGEFMKILEVPAAAKALQETGVDVVGLVDAADELFHSGDALSFPKFLSEVLLLRGSNTTTVKDMMELRRFLRLSNQEIQSRLSNIEQAFGVPPVAGRSRVTTEEIASSSRSACLACPVSISESHQIGGDSSSTGSKRGLSVALSRELSAFKPNVVAVPDSLCPLGPQTRFDVEELQAWIAGLDAELAMRVNKLQRLCDELRLSTLRSGLGLATSAPPPQDQHLLLECTMVNDHSAPRTVQGSNTELQGSRREPGTAFLPAISAERMPQDPSPRGWKEGHLATS